MFAHLSIHLCFYLSLRLSLPHGLLSCRSCPTVLMPFSFLGLHLPSHCLCLPVHPLCVCPYLSSLFSRSCSPTPSLPHSSTFLLACLGVPAFSLSLSIFLRPACLPLRCWRPRGTLGLVLHIPEQLLMLTTVLLGGAPARTVKDSPSSHLRARRVASQTVRRSTE